MTDCSKGHDKEHALEAAVVKERFEAHAVIHAVEARALELQAKEVERRFEGTNELRKQVVEDRAQFVKAETFDVMRNTVGKLSDRVGSLEGRFLGISLFAAILSAVALVVSLAQR